MKNRLNRRRFLKGAASLPILAASRARADNLLGLIGDGLWNPSYLTGICGAWSVNQVILNGSTVAAIKPYGPYWMTNAEGNPTGSTTLPALSGGRIVFDATRTFLESNEVTNSYTSAVTLPDGASGSTSGKGFTCTGLALDATDGTWWAGNYGKPQQSTAGSTTFASSIVHLSADFKTFLSEITFASLGLSMTTAHGGPQGVAFDTSDNTLWAASPEFNAIYHITRGGSLSATLSSKTGANGLCYDPVADQLYWNVGENDYPVFQKINKAGTNQSSFQAQIWYSDHCFIDSGDPGFLWASGGGDGVNDIIRKFNTSTVATATTEIVTDCQAIEGIYISGSTMNVCSDGYYHNGTLNQILTYQLLAGGPTFFNVGTRYQMFGIASIPGSPGSTGALISAGEPASTTSQKGAGLFFPSGSTTSLRFTTANVAAATWTGLTTTTEFLFFLDVDTVGKTAQLWINGVDQGSVDITAASPAAPGVVQIMLGSASRLHNGGNASFYFSAAHIANAGLANNAQANQAQIEGWCAWDVGQQALLPNGHAYKNNPPMV